MNFFEAQDEARKKTKWLILWFLLAVAGVVVAVNALVFFLTQGVQVDTGAVPHWSEWALPTTVVTAGIVFVASAYKSIQLSSGGRVVAEDLGGRLVLPGTTDYEERKLLNIVEEMAIASGMPVPQVFLMDREEGINAFAAGTEPSNAVIGVTRGCLQRLSRDELEGVIAHEFSHILNGDMRLNMRLIGLIFGLMVISILGRGLFEVMRFSSLSTRRDREGGGGAMAMLVLGMGLMIIGSIGVLAGRLMQAAVSRQREYLADASAVQFTRNPDGIANALKKIGGLGAGNRVRAPKAEEASHLFFSTAGLFSFGLATHPPLEKRIAAILGKDAVKFSPSQLPGISRPRDRNRGRNDGEKRKTVASFASGAVSEMAREESLSVSAAADLRKRLPEEWLRSARDREASQALIFGLLLAEDDGLREAEVNFLYQKAGSEAARLAVKWQEAVGGLGSAEKIALIDLSIPALRSLSPQEYDRFIGLTEELIVSDERVDLFEFMLQRLIQRHLGSHFENPGFRKVRYQSLAEVGQEVNLLISTVAGVGAKDQKEAQRAFRAAVKPLGAWPFPMAEGSSLEELTGILTKLDAASPVVKGELLNACARAAVADGKLRDREVEVIRATADALGCQIPPLLS